MAHIALKPKTLNPKPYGDIIVSSFFAPYLYITERTAESVLRMKPTLRVEGLGLGFLSLGLCVCSLGFGFRVSEFGVLCLGFRVWGLGFLWFGAWGLGFRTEKCHAVASWAGLFLAFCFGT